jgi:prepilin-type N-terminal cleavage/methylation domain-containing protein
MMKRQKGFTLVELVVVLAIFAAIVGGGILSFSNANKSSTVSEAAGDLVSVIKETQNLAKNNSLPRSADSLQKARTIYYYVLTIEGGTVAPYGKVSRYLFGKTDGEWNTDINVSEGNLKSKIFTNINYEWNVVGNGCKSIIFENLTGKMKAYNNPITNVATMSQGYSANPINRCEFIVKMYDDDAYIKTVYVDLENSSYGIKGE